MNWTRSNLLYVILIGIVIALVVFTVALQYLILNIEPANQATETAEAVQSATATSPPVVLPHATSGRAQCRGCNFRGSNQ